jgi:hypothetical protein
MRFSINYLKSLLNCCAALFDYGLNSGNPGCWRAGPAACDYFDQRGLRAASGAEELAHSTLPRRDQVACGQKRTNQMLPTIDETIYETIYMAMPIPELEAAERDARKKVEDRLACLCSGRVPRLVVGCSDGRKSKFVDPWEMRKCVWDLKDELEIWWSIMVALEAVKYVPDGTFRHEDARPLRRVKTGVTNV